MITRTYITAGQQNLYDGIILIESPKHVQGELRGGREISTEGQLQHRDDQRLWQVHDSGRTSWQATWYESLTA